MVEIQNIDIMALFHLFVKVSAIPCLIENSLMLSIKTHSIEICALLWQNGQGHGKNLKYQGYRQYVTPNMQGFS